MGRSSWAGKGKRRLDDDAKIRYSARLPPGIINSANDCFMNSVMQALIATPVLEEMITFRPRNHAWANPASSPALTNGRLVAGEANIEWTDGLLLSDTFIKFLENAYRARGAKPTTTLNPREIIRHLGTKFDQYLDFRQQDGHELLRHLLDAMYMDEMDIIKKRQPPVKTNSRRQAGRSSNRELNSSSGDQYDDQGWNNNAIGDEGLKLTPFASTVFGGKLASVIVCNTCKHISHTYEDFLDLSIPIKAEDDRKGRLRAFAQRFSSSPAPSPRRHPVLSGVSITKPLEPVIRVKTPSEETEGFQARLGRRVSTRLNKSRERFGGLQGSPSVSRASSAERDGPLKHAPPKQRSNKSSPQEAAYLRALLRDEPTQSVNPLSLLRSKAAPSSTVSTSGPPASHMWNRFGPSGGVLDCLRMFTAVEILEGENAFACHNCWKLANPGVRKTRNRDRSSSNSSSSSSSSSSHGDEGLDPGNEDRIIESPFPRPVSVDVSLVRPHDSSEYVTGIRTPSVMSEPIPGRESETSLPIVRSPLDHSRDHHIGTSLGSYPQSHVGDTETSQRIFPSQHAGLIVPSISTTSPAEPPADGDLPSDVPRFRRFSSYHTEKFLSPSASRESLASVPTEKTRRLGLNNRSDVSATSEDSAIEADDSVSALGTEPSSASEGRSLKIPMTPLHEIRPPRRSEQVIFRRALKRYLIDTPPPVLVIHLKRFQQTNKSPVSLFAANAKKIDDYVEFPELMDLRPFLAPKKSAFGLDERGRLARQAQQANQDSTWDRLHRGRKAVEIRREPEEGPVLYQLYGVVVHIGNMLGGHYIAYTALPPPLDPELVQSSTDGLVDEAPTPQTTSFPHEGPTKPSSVSIERQWCYISDTSVRMASKEEVLKSKAYLLFYERVETGDITA